MTTRADEQCPVCFHPLDPEDAADPFEATARLTATCPVSRQQHEVFDDVTLVTSYAAVSEVYHRRADFSNAHGHSTSQRAANNVDGSLFSLDGDAHRRVRRIIVAALSPHVVDVATPYIDGLARTVVDEIPDVGRADLRSAWATRIPGKAVAHMLGVPEDDHDSFFTWTMQKMAALARMTHGEITSDEVRALDEPFRAYMDEQLRLRRAAAGEGHDILSRLLSVEDEDGSRLTDDEIIANAVFLLNAGNQTTANLLTNLVHQLLTTDQWTKVRDDRTLVPDAIEESLRLTPPIQYGARRPVTDTEIAGCPVVAGEVLVLSHLGASRDPAVWGDDADRFRLERAVEAKHLGFGMGPHSCVGSAAARHIALGSINALLDRFEHLALAPDFVWRRQDYWTSMGMTSLDVVW